MFVYVMLWGWALWCGGGGGVKVVEELATS
jgi:hypothetical protein